MSNVGLRFYFKTDFNMLIRCIDVRDKSLSMAFNIVFISLFATLPAPIAYGALIDSTWYSVFHRFSQAKFA